MGIYRKRTLSVLLCLAMIVALFPQAAFAEPGGPDGPEDPDLYYTMEGQVLLWSYGDDVFYDPPSVPGSNLPVRIRLASSDFGVHRTDDNGYFSVQILKSAIEHYGTDPNYTEYSFEIDIYEPGFRHSYWGGNDPYTVGQLQAGEPVVAIIEQGGYAEVELPFDHLPARKIHPEANARIGLLVYYKEPVDEQTEVWQLMEVLYMRESYGAEVWTAAFFQAREVKFAFTYYDESRLEYGNNWESDQAVYEAGIFQYFGGETAALTFLDASVITAQPAERIELYTHPWAGDRGHAQTDTYPPHASVTAPYGADNPAAGLITINFDEPMDPAVPGTVRLLHSEEVDQTATNGRWTEDKMQYTADYSGLTPGHHYTVEISEFSDSAGNVMEPNRVHGFTVAGGYIQRALTDDSTGIMIAGDITPDAEINEIPGYVHAPGADGACDAIHGAQNAGLLLALHGISVSNGSFAGELTITIPVSAEYNDMAVSILHCKNGVLETKTATVTNGKVIFTLDSLSPIGIALLSGSGGSTIDLSDANPSASGTGWTYANNVYTILDGADVTVTGEDTGSFRRIEVAANATASITFDNATIEFIWNPYCPVRLNSGAELTLTLVGENTLKAGGNHAGIEVPEGTALTIEGNGSLFVGAGIGSAAIGGSQGQGAGSIAINGGMISVQGSFGGKIGSGESGASPGTFTMDGNAVVYAQSISDASPKENGILFTGEITFATGTVYGNVTIDLTSTLVMIAPAAYATLTIPNGASLTIPLGVTIYNVGTIIPEDGSTLTVLGTIDSASLNGNKVTGANVQTPQRNGTPTHNSLAVSPTSLLAQTGQDIEYAINSSQTAPASGWQPGTSFTGLTLNTSYYVFARSKEDATFAAGTPSRSAEIRTAATADTTPPVLTEGSVIRSSDTGGLLRFITTETGTIYYLVTESGASVPTKTEVKATGTSLGYLSLAGYYSGGIALTAGAKDVYVIMEDLSGNISDPLKISVVAYALPVLPQSITGVTSPVGGATPSTAINNGQYFTASLAWNGNPTQFAYGTVYSATITLTATGGRTFAGHYSATVDISGFWVNGIQPVFVSNNGDTLVFTVTFPATAPPAYTADITPASKTFTEAAYGYGPQAAQQFTIQNTGTGQITGLTAALQNGTASAFEIAVPLSGAVINPNESVTVSVRPKNGLSVAQHTDTLNITGGNGISLSAGLAFHVTKAVPPQPAAPTVASATKTSITLNTVPGAEYVMNHILGPWQDSPEFTGLMPGTIYVFYQRIKDTENNTASAISNSIAVWTDRDVMGGTVTISGTPEYSGLLTADVSGLTPTGGLRAITYRWYNDGALIEGEIQSTFRPGLAQIGGRITVTVTAVNCDGSITSAAVGPVTKAAQNTPTAPIMTDRTATSITLNAAAGLEYRRGDQPNGWQDSAVFSGLSPNTGYLFYARAKETVTHAASAESPASAAITTLKLSQAAPAAPALASKTAVQVVLTAPGASGILEYAKNTTSTAPTDPSQWQPSLIFDALNPNTRYYFFARQAETATQELSPASAPLAVTTNKAVLGGSVTIGGTAKFGETLTAQTGSLTTDPVGVERGELSYQWKRGGVNLPGATGGSYTLTQADIGAAIAVTVTAANCSGEVTSGATATVTKADGPAAPASVTGSYTGNGTMFTYTVAPITGAEYQMDSAGWQDSNGFPGIAPLSSHTFQARIKETATHEAGAAGSTGAVSFVKLNDRTAPVLAYILSGGDFPKVITITPVAGAEYSFDGGGTWSDSVNTYSSTAGESITLAIRLRETATHYASPIASTPVNTSNQSQSAPTAFSLDYEGVSDTSYTVTIPWTEGAEYSFDGVNWSGNNIKTGCTPGDTVTGYKRMVAKAGYNASSATSASVTLPRFQVKTPTALPNGGSFTTSQSVTLACTTTGAELYYTTDGSAPTTGSTRYSGPFTLTDTATVKAIAVKAGMTDSAVLTVAFTKTAVLSGDATLSALTISSGTMTPAFHSATTSYAVTVANDISSVIVSATANHSGATVSGAGTKPLDVGANTIVITVTAQDATVMRYTIIITRESGGTGGTGGTGGSGGDGYTSSWTISVDKQPDMPTTATITIPGTFDSGGSLTAAVPEAMVKEAITRAQAEAEKLGKITDGILVKIKITATGGKSLTVTVDQAAWSRLNTAGAGFGVTSEIYRFALDGEAVKQVNSQAGGGVTFHAVLLDKLSSAAQAAIGGRPAYEFTLTDHTGKAMTGYGTGTITHGIAYKPVGGEVTGSLFAVKILDNGSVQWITESGYTDGWVSWSGGSNSAYGVGYKTPAPAFTDTAGHWAKDKIDFVVSRGLFSGTSAATFSPDAAITRGMFVTALGKLSVQGGSGYTASSFSDVAAGSYYLPYIEWAVANQIVSGVGNGQFAPDKAISREEMAVMIHNYVNAAKYTLPDSHEAVVFTDSAQISAWAKDATKALQRAGIVSGIGNGMFYPEGTATRAEAAAILRNLVETVIDDAAARGWAKNEAGQWVYRTWDGELHTGWISTLHGSSYYMDEAGIMVTGKWVQIGGKWYYFYSDGKLAVNTTIQGHPIGEDGARKG